MDYEGCKGCLSSTMRYDPEYGYSWRCDIMYVSGEGKYCPCISCLVKGMCKNACEDFNNYP